MSTDRDRLAAALADSRPWNEPWADLPEKLREQFRITADVLLPVVDRIATERAAAELRAAGKALHVDPLLRSADYASYVKGKLDDRAAALRASNGEGAT